MHSVDLDVPVGKIGLVGESGSGKTQTVSVLGILPEGGRVSRAASSWVGKRWWGFPRGQGRLPGSVDTAHALASQRTDREVLYVAMTRARESNHLYFVVDTTDQCSPTQRRRTFAIDSSNAITREEEGSGLGVFTSVDPQ